MTNDSDNQEKFLVAQKAIRDYIQYRNDELQKNPVKG
jgi:hypothetical protein